jgi:uncharacterized radical SAM superfamily Fe-S cluster-containing enzyme
MEYRRMHVSTGIAYRPEDNPFTTVMVDVTHRCNMACRNCYIPARDIPDMDAAWLQSILVRLRRRARIRLVGAEPTVRRDLAGLVRMVRASGHLPQLLSNGLALANRAYVSRLKKAGLRTVYLSMNGGLRDDLYEAMDDLACAKRKLAALENLGAEHMYASVGMTLAFGVNSGHVGEFWRYLVQRPQVREVHLRSVGPLGRHMAGAAYTLEDLIAIAKEQIGLSAAQVEAGVREPHVFDTFVGRMQLQLTQWPDLGSKTRGRLTPEGTIEPFFEHVTLNASNGGY